MALTPPEHTDTLIKYTYDEDFYVQERACQMLGQRKFEPAIERLAEVAAENFPNAPYAARWALVQIGTPEALEAVQRVDDMKK